MIILFSSQTFSYPSSTTITSTSTSTSTSTITTTTTTTTTTAAAAAAAAAASMPPVRGSRAAFLAGRRLRCHRRLLAVARRVLAGTATLEEWRQAAFAVAAARAAEVAYHRGFGQ
ncbi:hypothetical protein TrVFT333_011468 [Trichoderma virens FT-333]|nr:hypothetical protein TrVFT333_011468 [Trichoderma virens FT-333]